MGNRVTAFVSGTLGPATIIVLLAGLSAACSDSIRLKKPLFTGSTENQRAIIDHSATQPMPPALAGQGEAVSRAPLPPLPLLAANTASPSAPADGPFAWTAVGGRVITVGAGETINDLAVKYGVPIQQILSANQLTRPSQVTAGRVIVIPRRVAISPESVGRPAPAQAPQRLSRAPAPASASPTPARIATAAPAAQSRNVHVVQTGDTLYGIALRYGARVDDLVRLNNLDSAAHIRAGQQLALTDEARPSAATSAFAAAKPAASPQTVSLAAAAAKLIPTSAGTGQPGATAAATPKLPAAPTIPVNVTGSTLQTATTIDGAADPGSADGKSFHWPVRGRIISGFGTKSGGTRNDGINLAVPEGTSVKATEAGTVIYAGNELEGYGNLILIRHTDGWVSAYAHNKRLNVARGDKVRRGQTIANAGMSGSVSSPQVHFELRRGAKPVNPLDYLAGA